MMKLRQVHCKNFITEGSYEEEITPNAPCPEKITLTFLVYVFLIFMYEHLCVVLSLQKRINRDTKTPTVNLKMESTLIVSVKPKLWYDIALD